MKINKIYNEDCLELLKQMPDNFIDCVITSPPYYGVRDYGCDGQWGLENTYQEYLQHLWQLIDGIYMVLKPSGTVWINLGDVYAGSNGNGYKQNVESNETFKGKAGYHDKVRNRIKCDNLPNKCLMLLPHRFAIGAIERGWILRNDCIWAKPNGMPESVTDRFSKKHEYFFFFVKSQKYYFNLDAVRDKHKQVSIDRLKRGISDNNKYFNSEYGQTLSNPRKNNHGTEDYNILGKNPGDVSDFWDIITKGSSQKHYASYSDSLLVKPVLSGCPENGIIFDPFMGSGSTAEVALRSNRNFIGSELSKEYCEIANKRLEPYLKQTTLNFK